MPSASGVFVFDASRLNLSEQEAATISEAIVRAAMAEIAKLDRAIARGVDLDKIGDPLLAARGFGGIAGGVVRSDF